MGPGSPGGSSAGGPPGPGAGGPGDPAPADDSRAEQVLSQALRAMAGGQSGGQSQPSHTGRRASRNLTTGQLVLLAAIIGLLVGIGAGLLSLLL